MKCSRFALWLERWRRYPLSFVVEACRGAEFGYPNHQQARMLEMERVSRRVAVGSGHGCGKSRWLAWAIWRHLICYKRRGVPLKVPVISPTDDANSDVIWSELALVKQHLLPYLGDSFVMTKDGIYRNDAELRDFWFCSPRTASKNRSGNVHGYHGTVLYVFDEANEIEDGLFISALGALTQEDDRMIMTANPVKCSGYFYRQFMMRRSSFCCGLFSAADNLSEVEYSYPYYDPVGVRHDITVNGLVSSDSVAGWAGEFGLDSPEYSARVLGRFPENELDVVIKRSWVDQAYNREYHDGRVEASDASVA